MKANDVWKNCDWVAGQFKIDGKPYGKFHEQMSSKLQTWITQLQGVNMRICLGMSPSSIYIYIDDAFHYREGHHGRVV